MDFLKTLMLYMTLTFATTVQGAPTPAPTPTPTPVPTPVVTPAPAEVVANLTGSVDGPIAATPTVTPDPDADLTPNPKYRTLKSGSRGDQVQAVQERLIEMGYLSGKADGIYGRNTARAVTAFQKANDLTADGVAGRATQTVLFEDPRAVWKNPKPTEVPAATEVPETAEPAQTPAPSMVEANLLPVEGAQVVVNGAQSPLTVAQVVEGSTVETSARVYLDESGAAYILLSDLATAEGFSLTQVETAWQLTAMGYEMTFNQGESGWTMQADGRDVLLNEGDIRTVEGQLVLRMDLFNRALGAECVWDADESAMVIRIQEKSVANAEG